MNKIKIGDKVEYLTLDGKKTEVGIVLGFRSTKDEDFLVINGKYISMSRVGGKK
jgi:hypothetical protein